MNSPLTSRNGGPIVCVVGARPNFMKMAPILRSLATRGPRFPVLLVHTGQHYDLAMNDRLFVDLDLPTPDVNLAVGSGSHAVQTAEVMRGFEPIVDKYCPSCVVVVGDVNSTLACALVAVKKGVPVAHVEAGLRSGDRKMPEEINRVLTDQIADRLYTTERSATRNLKSEGISESRISFVGNVMIDSLRSCQAKAKDPSATLTACGVEPEIIRSRNGYGVVTLHRPSNVDDPKTLDRLLRVLDKISQQLPLVFVLHPRTQRCIDRFEMGSLLDQRRLVRLRPQGYLEMLGLIESAKVVLTDSGGLQEETTALGVPCLTLRENTERPITVEEGTNTLVGTDPIVIMQTVEAIISGQSKEGRLPELWDGHAADRIVDDLSGWVIAHPIDSQSS